MYLIRNLESDIKKILQNNGYEEEVTVNPSNRPELGDYQYNGCMAIAGKNHVNPRDVANKIVEELSKHKCSRTWFYKYFVF